MNPMVVEFEVGAGPERAFELWTTGAARWWPREHTISRDPDLEIVFEPFAGGRIYERATDGSEHDWGEVIAWDPPSGVKFWWHLFFEREEATTVEVRFVSAGDGTAVHLTQTGFEILEAPTGQERRDETDRAWNEVVGYYVESM